MQRTDIKKAMSMLKEAHSLLKNSKVDNLKKSAGYLHETLLTLQKKMD